MHDTTNEQSNAGNEVDDVVRDLKKLPGFSGYCIMNNDGIVIKFENMTYRAAVHHAHLVLSLCSKASKYVRDLIEPPDNEVESIRLRTDKYEMIVAQHGAFSLIALQTDEAVVPEGAVEPGVEGAEGEAKKE